VSLPFDESAAWAYSEALCSELVLRKSSACTLRTIYFGGGTPSLLPHRCFSLIFECIRNNFSISPVAEITAEANPGAIDSAKTEFLLSLGMNRLSIGVQSLDERELRALGRIHSARQAEQLLHLAHSSGLTNVSVDLIYGIPGQSMESWERTLSALAVHRPAHVSAYELTPEEDTPFSQSVRSREVTLVDEETVLEMYAFAKEHLGMHGYEKYEISNFSQAGFRCAHNLNYWERGDYIGAGLGSHSFQSHVRSFNTHLLDAYIEKIKEGKLPVAGSEQLMQEDALKESLFLGLRKTEGVDMHMLNTLGLKDPEAWDNLCEQGLLELHGDRIRLTERGVVLSNTVFASMLLSLGSQERSAV
jgi:oxygen-independent coproporphyrinogen-3 oxidase